LTNASESAAVTHLQAIVGPNHRLEIRAMSRGVLVREVVIHVVAQLKSASKETDQVGVAEEVEDLLPVVEVAHEDPRLPMVGEVAPRCRPHTSKVEGDHHMLIAEVNRRAEVVGTIDAGVLTEELMTRVSATTDAVVNQTILDAVGGTETATNGDRRTFFTMRSRATK
jgi:hypothetical protein